MANPIELLIRQKIATQQAITVEEFMKLAMQGEDGYYRNQYPLGESGDFVTAPEISQLFGEMIGLWCLDMWYKNNSPKQWQIIEFGGGCGSLMRDILRVLQLDPLSVSGLRICFVEINPHLKQQQCEVIEDYKVSGYWVEAIAALYQQQ